MLRDCPALWVLKCSIWLCCLQREARSAMAAQDQNSAVWWMALSTSFLLPNNTSVEPTTFSHFPYRCELRTDSTLSERAACLRRDAALWATLQRGRDEGIAECRRVMTGTAWACPVNRNNSGLFGKGVLKGTTKEGAFLHSLMSAAIMRSIARACGQGLLAERCPCGQFDGNTIPGKVDWEWGNCSVNMVYGRNLARKITNPRNARRQNQLSSRSLLQVLNNAAGELALESVQRIKCKCHGLSTSCVLKTCFMATPDLQSTARTLAVKYEAAKKVSIYRGSEDRRPLLHLARAVKQGRHMNLTKYQLHYTDSSPDFCKRDMQAGIPGNTGRPCSANDGNPNSCRVLCCGQPPAVREERRRRCCRYIATFGGGTLGRKCIRPCVSIVRHFSCR